MAYNRDDDRKPSFPLGRFSGEGNMVGDPKDIGRDRPVAAFKVAFNSRNYKEFEGSLFISVTCTGSTAERVLAEGRKGKRVHVEGKLYMDEPWVDKDDNEVQSFSLDAESVSESWRFADRDGGSSSRGRRDDDEPRGRSGRSSRRDEGEGDADEPRGRSGRSSRRSEESEDEPRGRSGRSSRRDEGEGDGDADEPRSSRRSSRRGGDDDEPRSSRRSSRRVEDNGDSED